MGKKEMKKEFIIDGWAFIIVYGWAILAVVFAVFALWFFGVFHPPAMNVTINNTLNNVSNNMSVIP